MKWVEALALGIKFKEIPKKLHNQKSIVQYLNIKIKSEEICDKQNIKNGNESRINNAAMLSLIVTWWGEWA